MRKLLLVLFLVTISAPTFAACTGSSPNLSAPDTGNATTNGTNFQLCLNAAVRGDTITLTAGASYNGNFTLANKGAGTALITVQSSGVAALPVNVRVSPSSASSMAAVKTPNGQPVFQFNTQANYWQFIGLELTTANVYPTSTRAPALVLADSTITYGNWPDNITFDRCYVHAAESDPLPYRSVEEGFELDGSNITIKNNWIGNFMGWSYPNAIQTITAATNANPVRITLNAAGSSPGHPVLMFFDGGTGNWAALNGPAVKVATFVSTTGSTSDWTLQNYDQTTFALSNIDSTAFGTFTGQTVTRFDAQIANTDGITIIAGPGPYTIDNNLIESYYSPIFTGGGGTWVDPNNIHTVTGVTDLNTITISAGGNAPQIGDLVAFDTVQDQTITTATAGNPTILTVQTTRFPAGGLTPEGCIAVSGFTGSWAALNANWGNPNNTTCSSVHGIASVVDTTHISLPIDSTGFGAVTGSGMKYVMWTKVTSNPATSHYQAAKVTGVSGQTITTQFWGHQGATGQDANGNGNGILVAVGSTMMFRGLQLHNLTITHNTIQTRRNWVWLFRDSAKTCDNCTDQPPKGLWESKLGDHVTIRGNIFQLLGGDLAPHGGGVSLAANQANQIGSTPWTSNSHWLIDSNIFYNYTYYKISLIEEYESGSVGTDYVVTNNLFTTSGASSLTFEGGDGVTFSHNTVRNRGTGASTSGGYNDFSTTFNINTNSVMQNNVGNFVTYGVNDFSTTWISGQGAVVNHNYLIDNLALGCGTLGPPNLPAGNLCVANDAAMAFVNVTSADAGGDYHGYMLQAGSPGHNAASDGTDVGVNFTTLDAALGGGTFNGIPVQIKGSSALKGKVVIR